MATATEGTGVVRLLTIKKAVEESGIPKSTLMAMIYRGDINVIQRTKHARIYIDPAELARWAKENERNAQATP